MKGQLSAEMLLLLVVAIVAANVLSSAKHITNETEKQSFGLYKTMAKDICYESGYGPCEKDDDCCEKECGKNKICK